MSNIEKILYKEFGCEYPAGSTIFSEGDEGRLVYIIQEGQVQISKSVGDRSKVLGVLDRGQFFGEMALISDRPRSATATVLKDCRLLALDSEMFFKILRSSYEITVRIIEQLVARLAETDKRLETLLFTDATTRFVKQLDGMSPDEPAVAMDQLAYDIGVPLERLQRITGKLEEKGVIRIEEEKLSVMEPEKLKKLKDYLLLREEFGKIEE